MRTPCSPWPTTACFTCSAVYSATGVRDGFHNASHHSNERKNMDQFAVINRYHIKMLGYFLERLQATPDGDGNLLDNTLVMYGSPMGDSNIHNHKRCPLFFVGRAGGALKGGLHIKAADGTPMANAMLTVLHGLGLDDVKTFGDSTGAMDLNELQTTV